ncbi:MAG: WD40/YVTN/BNR-like repeat-containing protein [Thermoanaerobaculia bacterium]
MRKTILATLLLTLPLLAQEDLKLDSSTLGGLRARAIGPAVMGGRIAAIDGTADSPATIYIGAASGGVWKSTDHGTSFKPVFDQHIQSIGAVAIDKSKPETVWVGTGESCVRNSVSVGDGVYKTTDGGGSWTNMGLADTEHIARIAIDPKKSDTVFVCATGHLWNANEERGVFRTNDGGKTWKKVLYVDANSGCADLTMDPGEPQILYAAMWQFRRQPDFFTSGGPGSGLYRSTDGGETWTKLRNGLPTGTLGRIAVAVAPSRPSTVYAVVESKKTALFRSDDLGQNWREMNDSFNIQVRPFYFAHIVVDPKDHNRVYKPGLMLTFSEDGGRTFSGSVIGGSTVHADHHALWIHPQNTAMMITGTDGGAYQSFDRAQRWRHLNVLPLSQFYHVQYDLDTPYNVYGGLQDNYTWGGPSAVRSRQGIANDQWFSIHGGDGFEAQVDPKDPRTIYAESQDGNISRVDRVTNERKSIRPLPAKGEPPLRWNWNTPILISPHDSNTVYVGANKVFKSTDRGQSWSAISPDLSEATDREGLALMGVAAKEIKIAKNDGVQSYGNIVQLVESPKQAGVLYAGTDDGQVHMTKDGKSWTNITNKFPNVPKNAYVSRLSASAHEVNVVYASFDNHRADDMGTYVYASVDGGSNFRSIGEGIPKGHTVASMTEDPKNPNVL